MQCVGIYMSVFHLNFLLTSSGTKFVNLIYDRSYYFPYALNLWQARVKGQAIVHFSLRSYKEVFLLMIPILLEII